MFLKNDAAAVSVSVCMITYNHENYIEDAILGVLNQNTEYSIEFIVADDNSTDNTARVIESILATHPNAGIIKYYRHPQNLGMMQNFLFALNTCSGKYIATCEGDDYWVDPQKLQKQITFLENNSDYSLHVTKVNCVDVSGNHFSEKPKKWQDGPFGKDEILKDFDIQTSTFIFRNQFSFPEWYKDIWSGDFFLCWLALENGKGFYDSSVTSCYRVNPNGGQSFKDPQNKMLNLKKNLIGQNAILKQEKKTSLTYHLIKLQIIEANKLLLGLSYEMLDKKQISKYLKLVVFAYPLSMGIAKIYAKSLLALLFPKRMILALRNQK